MSKVETDYRAILKNIEVLRDEPAREGAYTRFCGALAACRYSFKPERTIVVAGTNGKGSTSKALQTFLSTTGAKVGLYTSPHLIDTRERIRVDGEPISREVFIDAYGRVRATCSEHGLSHFEVLTLMAAEVFFGGGVASPCDWIIFEVGVGGLYDATRAVPHNLNVITRLGFDHQALLGNSLREIAQNKFGIVERGSSVFHFPFDDAEVVQLAEETRVSTQSTWQEFASFPYKVVERAGEPVTVLQTPWGEQDLDLPGRRGAENVSLALQIAAALGVDPRAALAQASHVRWPGRMEKFMLGGWRCPVYLSGDHNPQGVASLAELLRDYKYEQLHLVIGISDGKDASEMMAIFAKIPRAKFYYTRTPFRPQPLEQAFGVWLTHAMFSNDNPAIVLDYVRARAEPGDRVVVTGSLYLVGEVRGLLCESGFL